MPRKESTAASSTQPPVRSFKASGAVEKMQERPWTERGITVTVITLGQHHPGANEVPELTVRVEDKALIEGLEVGERICVSGELGEREEWNQPAVVQTVERFTPGKSMDLVNEVKVVGKRVSAWPKKLAEETLYNIELELSDGSRVLVKVYKKKLREELEGTEDGQVLQIEGILNMFEYQGQDVTQVKASSIKVVE